MLVAPLGASGVVVLVLRGGHALGMYVQVELWLPLQTYVDDGIGPLGIGLQAKLV